MVSESLYKKYINANVSVEVANDPFYQVNYIFYTDILFI